jgi:thiamine pyrophosphokinase
MIMSISQELIDMYTENSNYHTDPKFRLAILSHMFDKYVEDLPELKYKIDMLIKVAKNREAA